MSHRNKESVSTSPVRLVDKEPGDSGVAQVADVPGSPKVAIQPEAARGAGVFSRAAKVVLHDLAARTRLAGVARVHAEEQLALSLTLLLDEDGEFVVTPAVESPVESAAFAADARSDVRQVLDHHHVRVGHDGLGDDVVLVAHVPSFSARGSLEQAFRGPSAFALQDLAKVSVAPLVAARVDAEERGVAGDGWRVDAEVHANDAGLLGQDDLGRGQREAQVHFDARPAQAQADALDSCACRKPRRRRGQGHVVLLATIDGHEADALRVKVRREAPSVQPDAGPRFLHAHAQRFALRDLSRGFYESLDEAALQRRVLRADGLVEERVRGVVVRQAFLMANAQRGVRCLVRKTNGASERVIGITDATSQRALHNRREAFMVLKDVLEKYAAPPPSKDGGFRRGGFS